jgi:lipopolysaccharide/colanic/teichoic acid biosynthesis glycosyltransferase/glycosyltransferase involved in cell wall biosynthesis
MGAVRILHITGDSRFGGVASIILGLGRICKAEGWQVDVLTTDPVFQQAVMHNGLGLINLDVVRRDIRPLWDLRGLFRLRRFLAEHNYTIVQTHTSKGGFVGRLAARLAGVPIIVHTAHGFAFHEGSPPSVRRVYTALERLAAHWCDRIVSVSEFHRDWAVELGICGPSRILAIPNGIEPLEPNAHVSSDDIRRQLGAQPGDLLVLAVTRLAADKGLRYLVEAAAQLPADRRIHVAIAGEGPEHGRLEQLAADLGLADRVTFVGFRKDVGDLLAACDVVVLPSQREGLSISLLEAMAAGKAIVATSIGSQREVAAKGEMALLVPPADANALRDGILRLAEDPALRDRLAFLARAVYERHYTEERMLESYRQLYLGLLEQPSDRSLTVAAQKSLQSRDREGAVKELPIHRMFDFTCALLGLVVLSPVLLALALLILWRDGAPVFFSQTRVGRNGKHFRIWKFRTMRAGSAGDPITAAGDARVTPLGAVLRRLKLDELPQLFNVLKGEMSLVGPRPEVPEYVQSEAPIWRTVLRVRPGVTDLATLLYRNEEALLGAAPDPTAFYRETVLPSKLTLNVRYLDCRTFWRDLKLIYLTVRYSLFPEGFDPECIRRTLGAGVIR